MRQAVKGVSGSFWWAAFIAMTLVIAYAMLAAPAPGPGFPGWLLHLDKVVHFVLFGIQAGLLVLALNPRCDCTVRPTGAGLVCTGYGLLLEIMQTHVPTGARMFSVWDLLADAAGAFACAFAVAAFLVSGGDGESSSNACCREGDE